MKGVVAFLLTLNAAVGIWLAKTSLEQGSVLGWMLAIAMTAISIYLAGMLVLAIRRERKRKRVEQAIAEAHEREEKNRLIAEQRAHEARGAEAVLRRMARQREIMLHGHPKDSYPSVKPEDDENWPRYAAETPSPWQAARENEDGDQA